MLWHYSGTIVLHVNTSISYNGRNILLLNDNLDMLYMKMKQIICHGPGWNNNDIDVEIT